MSTQDLAPDEKLCPFCAETIKSAAIRCRFCHSDLDPGPGAAARRVETPVQVDEVDEVDGLDDSPPPGPARPIDAATLVEPSLELRGSGPRLVAALVVLCLVLGGALGYLVHRAQNPHLDTAPNGQVTQNGFRNAAMSAASDAATKALSYSYKTFDTDRKDARALMGPKLAKEYDAAMDKVRAQTLSTRLTLKATVLSAGLISAKEHSARVLLFVNTVTTREGSTNQQLDQNRVVMDLTRQDGDWTVSKMKAF